MRIIYHLNTKDLGNVAEEAQWAEAMGYDGLASEETAHDPFLPLLLAANATSQVTLETRVAIAFPRSPMVMAYAARDLQDYSQGRFRLGLGTQVKGHIERRFSVPWAAPGPRLREYVQSLHAIWESWQEDTELDYQCRFYNFSLMTPHFSPGASPQPKPPVYVSAINPYNCQVAGEVCDGLALHPLTSAEYLKEVILPNVSTGAARSGRSVKNVTLSGGGFVVTGPNLETIEARKLAVKQQIAFYASTRTYMPIMEIHGFQEISHRLHKMSLTGQWERMGSLVGDEMLDAFAIVGGYDEVAWRLKERFGDLLDEVVFNMEVSSSTDEAALRGIIKVLQS